MIDIVDVKKAIKDKEIKVEVDNEGYIYLYDTQTQERVLIWKVAVKD